jgi:hypothetical protein
MKPYFTSVLAISVFQLLNLSAFGQGSLAPPGPPGPTMKTLAQIRSTGIPLNQNTAPGDDGHQFIISQAGSYFLTGNVEVSKDDGISIRAADVTVDLNGFRIAGNGVTVYGISIEADRATILHGSIALCSIGVAGFSAKGTTLRDLVVSGCTTGGILIPDGALVEDCRAQANVGSYGLDARDGSTLRNCIAVNNSCDVGIVTGAGCTLSHCAAKGNIGSGSSSYGIEAGPNSVIVACTAYGNQTSKGTPTGLTGAGIHALDGSRIIDSVAGSNQGDGIVVSNGCYISGNVADGNGASGDGAGIHATGSFNRIEANQVAFNDRGIDVQTLNGRNLIVKNSARSNTANYVIEAGNRPAQIVVPAANANKITDANSGSTDGFTNVDPWANFSY